MTSARFIALVPAWVLSSVLLAQAPGEVPETVPPAEAEAAPVYTRILVRSEKLASGSKLWVKNRNGDIVVVGWEKEEMQLTAEIRDTDRRKVELVIKQKNGDLDIETLFQQPFWSFDWGLVQTPRCELTVFVPRKLSGYFRTTNGSVYISYIDGYAHCETTNGDIQVKHLSGETHLETKNGTIECQDLQARVQAVTTNGQLILIGVDGGILAQTTNGSVLARGLNGWGEGITITTTNGSLDISLGAASGEVTAESSDGSLDIKVPEARVIESSKQSAHLVVPGRTQKISLRTASGNITLRE